jgi:hypothetical protein
MRADAPERVTSCIVKVKGLYRVSSKSFRFCISFISSPLWFTARRHKFDKVSLSPEDGVLWWDETFIVDCVYEGLAQLGQDEPASR